jgi:hypothetical protein
VVLYQLLTEELPFRGNAAALLHQVLNEEPPSPRSLDATISHDLETICLKCLEKDADKRYQTAHELANDLQRFRRGEPIDARPISRAERVWRWCRRKPMTATAATLLAIIAVASPIIALRERLHGLELAKMNRDNTRLIQQLTSERDNYKSQVGGTPELRTFRVNDRVSPASHPFIRLAYDQYSAALEQILQSAANPEDRCLATLGIAILAKEVRPENEAIDALLRARGELEKAVSKSPNNQQLNAGLAFCYDALGEMYGKSGQPTLDQQYREKAGKMWAQLADGQPSIANYRAMAENQLSIWGLKNTVGDSERAMSLLDETKTPSARELQSMFPRGAKQLYEVACELANCRAWLTHGESGGGNNSTAPTK